MLFDAGREQEAIQAWTKLLYMKSQTVEAEVKLATLLIEHGLLDEALSVLDRASEKATDAKAIYQVGAALAEMNEFDRARPHFQRILQMPKPPENATQNVTAHSPRPTYGPPGINTHKFNLVQRLYPQIQQQLFRNEIRKTLKNQPQANSSLRTQIPQRFGGGSWQPWMPNSFEEARAGALVQLMLMAQWRGKQREFIQQFEAAADANPKDIQTLERLVQLYILTANTDKAREITQRLIAASPNDPVYHGMRLSPSTQQNLDYETVKKYRDEMTGVAPQAQLWYIAQYARRLWLQRKKADAAKLLDEFKDAKVTDPGTASQLVIAFAQVGKIDAAEKIIAQFPNQAMSAVSRTSILDKATHLYLARTYERNNMVDKAIAQYEKISELEPNNVRWYITITNLYERLHRTDKAKQLAKTVALYKKAIKIVPTSFELHYLLATTYAALDQSSEAEVVYRRALDLSLKAHEHDSVLRHLGTLRRPRAAEQRHRHP